MFAPWRKSYDKPTQHIKNRDLTLPTNVHTVKAIVFPVVMYACGSWTIKKAEHQRTDAFKSHKPCGRTKKKKKLYTIQSHFYKTLEKAN